jgi:CRP-like cAMP-binding protein
VFFHFRDFVINFFVTFVVQGVFTMDILSSCYLFKGVTSHQIDELAKVVNEVDFEKEAWLFHEGSQADRLYFLENGAIDLLTTIESDVELPTARLKTAGDCFGTGALVEPFTYSLSARCVETASLLTIDRGDLTQLMEKDSDLDKVVMGNLAKHYLDRLREARQELKIHFKILLKVMRF